MIAKSKEKNIAIAFICDKERQLYLLLLAIAIVGRAIIKEREIRERSKDDIIPENKAKKD